MVQLDDSDSEFVCHEPCPSCGSSDANAVYTDGHTHCFSCGHHTGSTGDTIQKPNRRAIMDFTGEIIRLKTRNINQEQCKKFNVRYDSETQTIKFPYYDEERQLCGFKGRQPGKDFFYSGVNSKTLFGQQLWGKGKSITITEGEIDALSVFKVRPTWPVVSIPNGAKSARKSLERQLKWLLNFEEIILFFDSDSEGQKAAQECAPLFPHNRCKIATISPYKDANEAIQAGDTAAVLQAIYNAEPWKPKTIIDGSTLFDLVQKPLTGKDASWPFIGLNSVTMGLRLGELVTVTAGTGVGKSTFCGEVAQHLVDEGHTIGYIALEESIQRTALRLMSVKADRPLHIDNSGDLKGAFDATLGTGRVFLRDGFGSVDPDAILADCRFLVMAHGVKWIVLDHLSILLSGNDTGDERKLIDVTMTKLRSFVEETRVGMLLISHLRRPQGDKGHEDGGKVSLGQLRGSHAIVQLSDIVIALERNLSAGDDESNLVVLKNRFNGRTGPAGVLCYNTETGRQTEILAATFNSLDSSEEEPF